MKIKHSALKGRNVEVSTASLPDIIFTLLFFFIVTGQVKEKVQVKHDLPALEYVKKLKADKNVTTIHVGFAFDEPEFGQPLIEMDGQIIRNEQHLLESVYQAVQNVPREKRHEHLFSIEADEEIPYGTIDEIKQTLRFAEVERIHYRSKKRVANLSLE